MTILWFGLRVCRDLQKPCLHFSALEQVGIAPSAVSQSSKLLVLPWLEFKFVFINHWADRDAQTTYMQVKSARRQTQQSTWESALLTLLHLPRWGFGPVHEHSHTPSPSSPWEFTSSRDYFLDSFFKEVILLKRIWDLMLWRWLGHNSWLQSLTGIGTALVASVDVAIRTLVTV